MGIGAKRYQMLESPSDGGPFPTHYGFHTGEISPQVPNCEVGRCCGACAQFRLEVAPDFAARILLGLMGHGILQRVSKAGARQPYRARLTASENELGRKTFGIINILAARNRSSIVWSQAKPGQSPRSYLALSASGYVAKHRAVAVVRTVSRLASTTRPCQL